MNEIFAVIELLKKARQAESYSAVSLADTKAALEREKAIAVAEGYEQGKVSGSNAETRRAQEANVLAASTKVREVEIELRQIESKHVADRIEVDYQRERYAALLALTRVEADAMWPGA